MIVKTIKLTHLPLILVPNNNYELKKKKLESTHITTIFIHEC